MNLVTLITILQYAFIFFTGCCIGSFGNVLIYRIPNKLDFVRGRSFCPACSHTLSARDLVPLVSFLFLHGRCRYCGGKISARYPLIESLTGLAAVAAFFSFGATLSALAAFFAGFFLIVIAMIDLDTMEIPDGLIVALLITAVLSFAASPQNPALLSRVIGFAAVSVPMVLINLMIPESFGGGDIKLVAVMGLLLGWRALLAGIFFALITGGGYGALLLVKKKAGRKDHFAFGPFLSFGLLIALFAGDAIFAAYLTLFMP